MDNSKPPSPGGSRNVFDDTKPKGKRSDNKPENADQEIKIFTDYARTAMNRLKKKNFSIHVSQIFKADDATQSKLTKQLSSVEEKIRMLFDKVLRQVLNFLSKDIENLKNHTREDRENLKKILSEYNMMMEKILEEHTKNVDNIRMKIHTGIISQKEIEQFISLFDKKMREIMKETDKMFGTLSKSELDTFKKNIRKVLQIGSDEIENSNDSFIESLEKMGENSSKTIPAQKSNFPHIKLPNISNMFALMPLSNASQSHNNNLNHPTPLSSIKGKLPSFNIKKFFDSETNKGRANAAKVTYLGVLIGFLYWKWRSSKS